jgi:cyclase
MAGAKIMLATRIIPTVLIRGNQLVKGKQFNSWRSVGHAEQAARIYASRQCDEIILLDISATPEGRGPNIPLIEKWTDQNFAPITVGGGVRTMHDVRDLLNAGADKVSICSQPECIRECAEMFGSQAIVAAIDVDATGVRTNCGKAWIVAANPVGWAIALAQAGAGEILLTSIDREGTLEGYDIDLIREVSAAVSIPVIANGGCSGPEDMYNAIQAGASAVAAGALFSFTDETPKSCAKYLAAKGIEVRLT